MEYKEINLKEWKLKGGGKEGESYINKKNPDKLLKLYHEHIDYREAEHELELAKLAYSLGIPTPAPGEMVSCGKRKGITFNNIPNKRSICRVMAEEPKRIKEMAQLVAEYARNLHQMKVELPEGVVLEDYRDFILDRCDKDNMPAKIREGIKRIVREAPSPYCLNHGDLHFGNLITNGENTYFIDMGRFKYGTIEFELSTLYCVCFKAPNIIMKLNFHITVRQARKFWREFINAYYGSEEEAAAHLEKIKEWALVRTELICAVANYNPDLLNLVTGNFKSIAERHKF